MSAAPQLKPGMKLKIEIQKGPHTGQSFSFEQEVVKIGRGSENDLVLANDSRSSRYHAEIRFEDDQFQLKNVSQKNYVAVNGKTTESAPLASGDNVVVGESEFRIEFAVALVKNGTEEFAPPAPAVSQQVTKLHALQSPAMVSAPRAMPPIPNAQGIQPNPYAQPAAAPGPRRAPAAAKKTSSLNSSRVRFYVIVAVVGLGFFWLMSPSTSKKKELTFRSTAQVEKDLESSREEMKALEERREKMNTVQFKRAQENFIRGFRDYKQGNFARARESFQVVLNLDPDNPLALRYYNLSKVKFDEMVKFHMLQGNRYREKKNWHLCRASYFNVMTMLNNSQDPAFKEAKQYYDECTMAQEGNY